MYRVYEAIGVQHRTIPKDRKGVFDVDGHTVVLFKSGKGPLGASGRKGRKYFHRLFFVLPNGRLAPVGRIRQALRCRLRLRPGKSVRYG
jgi:hypothetical protein